MDNINREVIQPAAEHVSPGEIVEKNGVAEQVNPLHPELIHAQEVQQEVGFTGANVVGLNIAHTDQPQVELPQPNIDNQPMPVSPGKKKKPLLFRLIMLVADLFKNTHNVTKEAYKLETKGIHHIGDASDINHQIQEKIQKEFGPDIDAAIKQNAPNNVVDFPNTNPER